MAGKALVLLFAILTACARQAEEPTAVDPLETQHRLGHALDSIANR